MSQMSSNGTGNDYSCPEVARSNDMILSNGAIFAALDEKRLIIAPEPLIWATLPTPDQVTPLSLQPISKHCWVP
jgi:hypothetical protein